VNIVCTRVKRIQKLESAGTWVPFPAWKKRVITSAQCSSSNVNEGREMFVKRQKASARRNIAKVTAAARTIAHLPKSTRRALGKQAAKAARSKARSRAA
jgi:hypothetical protein